MTICGQRVVGGWFPLVSSEGVPLEVILSEFKERKMVPDWMDFIEDAVRNKWKLCSLRTKIEVSVGDVYGSDYRDEIMKRLDFYINMRD